MCKRLFFFDIDGTICKNNYVSPRVKNAIHKIQENGDLCFIASGRPKTFLQEAVKEIGFDGFILFNGALMIINNEVIHDIPYPKEELKEILNYLRKHHSEYILQNAQYSYLDHHYQRLYDFFKDRVVVNVDEFVRDFNEEDVIEHILKIEIWPDTYEISQQIMKDFPQYKWHQYQYNMELCQENISKARAIQKVIDMYQVDHNHTYCFGDGPNDLEMFSVVKHSYAMDNADEQVKKHAKYICPSIQEDGVAVILESLLKK